MQRILWIIISILFMLWVTYTGLQWFVWRYPVGASSEMLQPAVSPQKASNVQYTYNPQPVAGAGLLNQTNAKTVVAQGQTPTMLHTNSSQPINNHGLECLSGC